MVKIEEIVIYASVAIVIIFYIVAISLLFSIKNKSYNELQLVEKPSDKDHNELGYVRGIYEIHSSSAFMGLAAMPIVILVIYILIAKEFEIFPFVVQERKCPTGTLNTKIEVPPNES